jgi:hypothetical protein
MSLEGFVGSAINHPRIDDMTPTPEARWAQLCTELRDWQEYPKTAIATLRAEREIFQPLMLAELAELVDDPDRLVETDFFTHIHLLALLAEWRETAAWPLLLRLFRHMDQECYEAIYSIDGSEYLVPLVAALMPAGTAPLDEMQALLEMPKVSVWLRADMIEALWYRTEKGLLPREELSSRLRQVLAKERAYQLARNIEAQDEILLTAMLESLAKLGDAQSIPLVQLLFDEQLVDPWYCGKTMEDYTAYMRGEKVWREKYPLGWVDDATVFVKQYFYRSREKEKALRPQKSALPSETIFRSDPKIGRNAPCPCGSGKKYKKCCGA